MKPIAHIDSERIGIPGLTGLLKTLGEVCGKHEIPFFLIGALARNLLLEHVHGVIPTRLTLDVDIAVAVTDWGHYETLSNELTDRYGYVGGRESHRLRSPEGTLLDLVPYGEIESTAREVRWPPDQAFVMNTVGFQEAYQSAVVLSIGDAGEVRVASLPGLGILKLIAWSDRPFERTKDAEDLCFILRTYHETVGGALYDRHSDVFDAEPFHWYVASATIYGRDVGNVLRQSDPARTTVMRILKDELHDEDQSSLAIAMGRECLPEYTERIDSLRAFYGGIQEAIAGYGEW